MSASCDSFGTIRTDCASAETEELVRSAVLKGMLWAVGLVFPLAGLCALIYRFPIPFAGYESGLAAVPLALVAVVFYGIIGGFPALMAAGALGGAAAHGIGQPDPARVRLLTVTFAGLFALAGVIMLAILDKLIGPW
jgi:hypothetical protein